MTRIYLFVEGQTDAAFLRRVLPAEATQGVEFVVAGGRSRIRSLARSYLVQRRIPVAVLMDADSVKPEVVEERRAETEELIRMAAGGVPVKVVVAVPEIEAWFFAAPEVIERVMGEPVPAEWVYFGARDPKGVLEQLSQRAEAKWDITQAIASLTPHDIDRIRAVRAVHELTEFLTAVLAKSAAAV
ncbi:MAG: DUF4276 family protein [Gemmataceae bacterium]